MILRKLFQLAAVMGVSVLLLNAGECISPFFANKEARECCTRGKCGPSKLSDDCCKTSSTSAGKHFVRAEKFSPAISALDTSAIPVSAFAFVLPTSAVSYVRTEHPWLGPPLELAHLNLPLLV